MKKTVIAGTFALAAMMILSCTKEMNPISDILSGGHGRITATATIEGQDTKTDYVSNAGSTIGVTWSSSDSFKAYYGASFGSNLVFSTADKGTTFTSDKGIDNGTDLYAVYGPVTIGGAPASPTYTIDLSGQESGGETESVANLSKYDAMIASAATVASNKVKFTFAHKCAFLRLNLQRGTAAAGSADQEKTVSVTIKNCAINAESGVTYSGWTYDSTNKILKIDITLSAALATGVSKTIYVAIPPLSYVSGTATGVEQGIAPSFAKTFTLSDGGSFAAGRVYDATVSFTPAVLYASFGTPAPSGSYSSPTYTWTAGSNNLMTVFEFSNGELANYRKLKWTTSNLSDGANYRFGYELNNDGVFHAFNGGAYYSAGTKDDIVLSSLGIDLSKVTKIQFGGNSGSGSIDILARDIVLVGDALVATFGTPGSEGSYSFPTYSWTKSYSNLMNCFSFPAGELANYSKLVFTTVAPQSGNVRVNFQYGDGSSDNLNISMNKYGSDAIFGSVGTKTITMAHVGTALATVSKTLADVKAIRFGGATDSGNVDIHASEMYLVK